MTTLCALQKLIEMMMNKISQSIELDCERLQCLISIYDLVLMCDLRKRQADDQSIWQLLRMRHAEVNRNDDKQNITEH